MGRIKLIQQIYDRLASLEQERLSTELNSNRYNEINTEISHLRIKLQEAMNNVQKKESEEAIKETNQKQT